MEEIGNWQAATQNIWNCGSSDDINQFKEQKNELDKVRFIANKGYISTIPWLEFYLKSCEKLNLKCSEKSVKYRNQGNKLFQQKRYSEALQAYTQSIQSAPIDSEDLGLAYGNHSAANFYLHQYKACIADVESSLASGYPESSAYKLLLRSAHCHHRTGNERQAEQKLQQAKRSVLEHKDIEGKRKEKILEEIRLLEQEIDSERPEGQGLYTEKDKTFDLFMGNNSILPQASGALEMKTSKEKGRYIQATSCIPAGSIIITEKPYAAVLLPEHYKTHCHHCLQKLTKIVTCRRCTAVLYCSEMCRGNSWSSYHQVECHYIDICQSVGIAHLSLRIVLTAGYRFLLEFRDKLKTTFFKDADRIGGDGEDGCYNRTYLSVYDLMTHADNIITEDSLQYSMTAVLLLTILKQSGWLNTEPTTSDEPDYGNPVDFSESDLFIGSLLLRHVEQLVCNAHAITDLLETTDLSLVDTKSQDRIGTAIYPTTSLLNHSCEPSIIAGFNKDLLVVRVIKDVRAGEEIFNCYGPHHRRMNRHDRQQALKSQYFFTCQCPPCQSQEDSDIFMSFCCPHCKGPLHHSTDQGNCNGCNYTEKLETLMKKESMSHDLFVEGLKCLQIQDVKGAIQKFSKCLNQQSQFLYKHHKGLAETQDCLARCYAISEQYVKAVPLLRDSVNTMGMLYGTESIEYANELHKFAGVLYHAGDIQEVIKVIDNAVTILTRHFGATYELVLELNEMKMCLLGKIKLK